MTVDRRVRKTREAIYSAFAGLVVERGFDAITVQEILDAADVARATFYAHFPGKDAVLNFGFERLAAELDTTGVEPLAFLEPLLLHARAHAGLYAALLRGGGAAEAEAAFRALVTARLPGSDELTRAITAGALVGGLKHWLAAGARSDVSELAGKIRRIAAL